MEIILALDFLNDTDRERETITDSERAASVLIAISAPKDNGGESINVFLNQNGDRHLLFSDGRAAPQSALAKSLVAALNVCPAVLSQLDAIDLRLLAQLKLGGKRRVSLVDLVTSERGLFRSPSEAEIQCRLEAIRAKLQGHGYRDLLCGDPEGGYLISE